LGIGGGRESMLAEEKVCWLRRNPAFEVVKTDFKNQKSFIFLS